MLIIKRGKLDTALLATAYTEENHFAQQSIAVRVSVFIVVVFFYSFTIRVPGFGAVVMDLNYICQCECEKPSMAVSLFVHGVI